MVMANKSKKEPWVLTRRDALKSVGTLALGSGLGLSWETARAAVGPDRPDSPIRGAKPRIAKAPNGALVNAKILENKPLVWHTKDRTYEVMPGVHVIAAGSLNGAFIVGDDGVIVWESGEGNQDGAHFREEIAKVTDKPIKALIYSHAHYSLGSQALLADSHNALVIGHPKLNANIAAGGGLGSYFPETEPVQWARIVQHLQMFLPEEGPDGQYGFVVNLGERGFVPVNTPVENGEELTVAGVRLQFFSEGGADTDDCITVWAPDLGLCLANALWPMAPTFYTPRGAMFRDPRVWRRAIEVIQRLDPKVLINQHAKALDDQAEIRSALADYHAFCGLVLDQTLRGILHGYGPEDLRGFIQLPPKLAESPWLFESYGLLEWYAPYIMNYALGWWDGDAATLAQVTPGERARRLVPLMGGRDRVMAEVRTAEDAGDLVWALELLNYLWREAEEPDAELRETKARLMRAMAQATTASIHRAFLLTQALAYEGRVTVPKVVAPQADQVAQDPADFVNRHRVRIDPLKAGDTDALVRFEFPSRPAVGLHIHNGVADFVPEADAYPVRAAVTLKMTGEVWQKLYVNAAELSDLVTAGEASVEGDVAEAEALLGLFDRLVLAKNNILQRPRSIQF